MKQCGRRVVVPALVIAEAVPKRDAVRIQRDRLLSDFYVLKAAVLRSYQ